MTSMTHEEPAKRECIAPGAHKGVHLCACLAKDRGISCGSRQRSAACALLKRRSKARNRHKLVLPRCVRPVLLQHIIFHKTPTNRSWMGITHLRLWVGNIRYFWLSKKLTASS